MYFQPENKSRLPLFPLLIPDTYYGLIYSRDDFIFRVHLLNLNTMKIKILLSTVFLMTNILLFSQDPGTIDEDFAENGTAWFDFGDQYLSAYCTGIQSDHKMISAGCIVDLVTMENDLMAIRVNPDGTLDNFGNQGDHMLIDINALDNASRMYINQEDEIFLVSSSINTNIIKLDPQGMVDETFGEDGIANTDLLMDVQDIKPFVFETFEHLILCGMSLDLAEPSPGLCIIFEDGTENEYFGDNGLASIDEIQGSFSSVVYLPETEEIYACGIRAGIPQKLLIAKFNFDGELNQDFGTNGYIVEENPTGFLSINKARMVYDEDHDHLIIACNGEYAEGDTDILLRRVDGNGNPVYYFGNDGWAHVRMFSNETINSVALQEDGMIYYAGITDENDNEDFIIGRIGTDGLLDDEFGENGVTVVDHLDRVNRSNDIILNPDEGRLILGGNSRSEDNMHSAFTISKFFTGFYTGTNKEMSGENNGFSIYPNPAKDHFYIKIPVNCSETVNMEIFNQMGQVVFTQPGIHCQGDVLIKNPGLSKGSYVLKISTSDFTHAEKLIIK